MKYLKYTALIFHFLLMTKISFGQPNHSDAYQFAVKEIKWIGREKANIPIKNLGTKQISHLILGTPTLQTSFFKEQLDKYTFIQHFQLPIENDFLNVKKWLDARKSAGDNLFILELWELKDLPFEKLIQLSSLFEGFPLVKVNFEKNRFEPSENPKADWLDILTLPDYWTQSLTAQLIFGGFNMEKGVETTGIRLGYAPAETVNMNLSVLEDSIKSIIEEGIGSRAFPGAQVLVARKGKVIYHEAFGNHTYEGGQKLSRDDLYDMASVTK